MEGAGNPQKGRLSGGAFMFSMCGAECHSSGAKSETEPSECDFCFFHQFFKNEDGQGITEYGAIIAFASLLVALTFSAANGSLMPAVSAAFRAVNSQLNALSTAASSAS